MDHREIASGSFREGRCVVLAEKIEWGLARAYGCDRTVQNGSERFMIIFGLF